jgi:hypothetical protein
MQNAQEILTKINWFLKPISDLILFLFTTKAGLWILILAFIGYLIFPVFEALKVRRLLYKAAYNNGNFPFLEKAYITLKVMGRNFAKFVTQVPVLVVVVIVLFLIVGLSTGLQSIESFVADRNKIKELQSIFKQLDQRYKVAEISVTKLDRIANETNLSIKFYDNAVSNYTNTPQDITLKGSDIYFDAVILNFDYSEIATGEKRNLVIPYRIFSEVIPQEQGIILKLKDADGIPFIFKRDTADVYGVTPEKYTENIRMFSKFLTDPTTAKTEGVRSAYGNAVHKKVREGQILTVWIEQTGGLVIKDKEDF